MEIGLAGESDRGEIARLIGAAHGDDQSVEWLMAEIVPAIYGFVHPRVSDDQSAADILQDVSSKGFDPCIHFAASPRRRRGFGRSLVE